MEINIKRKSRRLETISKGDVLIFPDREEVVEEVDLKMGSIFTQRKVPNTDRKSPVSPEEFPIKVEKVRYGRGHYLERITPNSIGKAYQWEKRRAA